ncbi:AVAST type 4 anti-phage nuclease Avs4 [Psychromonas sp. CNPT3]|uniref:AVAST type 4 anti-phage nuclease Avs4 n=1 Tax=Psychromonas sp. CNPT3 TaxID=314282 RepID=UPI0012EAE9B3|nr:AVAST type 4 anti-phage nuclease Avs4 [Psychromonas sp. CNPT3]
MIKPNWDIFKAKFSENPQYHFEWFCYLLFCKETKKIYGVFRYKNQSAIETNPVDIDGHCIGFQSKFYTTTLSSNKAELISTLEKAKRDYPKLTKLLLYTNQEWGQAYPQKNNPIKKAVKSATQIEIENKASQLGIVLEWRTASYFESPFVSQTCADIGKYFFISNNSLFDLINAQERHTQSILKNIKQSIPFKGNDISIERASVLDSLKETSNKVSIVCGKGGVGKTVEIKKFYQEFRYSQPIFAFKANEFEINELDDLIKGWSTDDFLSLFGDSQDKVLVIDSAEKLMDLNNQEPIKEFIDLSVARGWKIIFTTRDHYFDDLNHLCLDVLDVIPNKLYIPELTEDELDGLANKYSFNVPSDSRLRSLLKLPFYLNAYLKFYNGDTKQPLDTIRFKDHLWNKKIKNGDIKREKVFSELAFQRANTGKFYLSVTAEDIEAADALSKDEVLGIDGTSFFISHDIYEEWALEKFIDISFKNKLSTLAFFTLIGNSLAIRRSFRLWLSEQLFVNETEIKSFIENAIDDDAIEPIWKDEVITAVLLSDYSYTFFDSFETELLQNNLELLQRINSILRITCKEIDNSKLNRLGLKLSDITYFTIPKGAGWSAFINFIFDKKDNIGLVNLKPFISVLNEWNSSVKQGETTRKASLLCLEYYRWLESEDSYIGSGKFTDSVIKTIAYGANEIKTELALVIDEICGLQKESKNIPYEHLAKLILKKLDGVYIAKALPEKTLELANYCWLKNHQSDGFSRRHRDAENIFGVVDGYDFNYHPESAFQTPIFNLLGFSLKATVDFILGFINQVTLNLVNHYGKDKFYTHELTIGDRTNKIYIDEDLWSSYRGAGNTPNLIKSILMALEKFLLKNVEHFTGDNLEAWLKYMLKNTNSSAICGVISSIVLANKVKLFNVAKILFEVKEFIKFDTARLVFDSQHKAQLEMLGNMTGGFQHEQWHHNERVKACDANHRANSLEKQCLCYQVFAQEGVDEAEVQRRKKAIWELLDSYYGELEVDKDLKNSKLWRMSLARMDSRKMDITTEEVEGKIAVYFNPELDPDLKDMSKSHQEKQQQDNKFLPLCLWARHKIDKKEDSKKYEQYEYDPNQVIADLKDLFEKLTDEENPPSENFVLFNRYTHIYASAALIKYYHTVLDENDLSFCLRIIEDCLNQLFNYDYRYQIRDGMDACFTVISDLFVISPENISIYKVMLIAGLMRTDSTTMMGSQRFNAFAIVAIVELWNIFDKDVQAIYWGYLTLFPIYIELIDTIRKEGAERKQFNIDLSGVWERLFEENESILKNIEINNIVELSEADYTPFDLHTKSVAIYILPNDSRAWVLDSFKCLINTSVNTIFGDDRRNSNNYQARHDFLRKFSSYLLSVQTCYIPELINPLLEQFNLSEGAADLLEEIVRAQDGLNSYENFWLIWNLFKPKVIQLAQEKHLSYRFEKIVKNYLFALSLWKKDAKNWHTLKDKNSRFFNEMAGKLSNSPSTLYSFGMLLNGIGSQYLPQGVGWIAKIIKTNSALSKSDLSDDTIYYLKVYMRTFLYRERSKVRRTPELMVNTLIILDLLIDQGEVSGYLMRENIL